MSKVIIHHENIPYSVKNQFSYENMIGFDYLNRDKNIKSLDEYITEILIEQLKDKSFEIIYIKDNLSSNYLELYGLRVAYHIRLSQELKDKRYVPIVILSDLDGYTLNKLEPSARILFTEYIYLEPNNQKTIEKFGDKKLESLSKSQYKSKFLDLIEIESPENSTNHSISNEWAIFKWAKELNISNSDDINNTISNISHQLYFKYLKVKYDNEDKLEVKTSSFKKKPKIIPKLNFEHKKVLYIDDENYKGWKDIVNQYFSLSNIIPKTLSIEFKNKEYEDIEEKILKYIEEYEPDLILLDMRLVNSDHTEAKAENISGIKILNKIKNNSLESKINPGIQVIMLSATTRSDILEQANKDNKIVGYIQKDHIDNSSLTTKENIEKLSKIVCDSEKKFFLKNIWELQTDILKLNIFTKKEYNEIKKETGFIFEILNSDMENKLKFTMLTIYKVLEIIKDLYIDDSAKFKNNEEEIKAIFYTDTKYQMIEKNTFIKNYYKYDFKEKKDANKYYYSTTNKIRSVVYEKLFVKDKILHDIIGNIGSKRNKYIHPDKGRVGIEVTKDEIIEWFENLNKIITKIDKIETNK